MTGAEWRERMSRPWAGTQFEDEYNRMHDTIERTRSLLVEARDALRDAANTLARIDADECGEGKHKAARVGQHRANIVAARLDSEVGP